MKILYNSLHIAEMIKTRSKVQGIAIKDMLIELELGSNTISHMRHGRAIASDSLARIADYLDEPALCVPQMVQENGLH